MPKIADGRGRPPNPRFSTKAELVAALASECRRRFETSADLRSSDVDGLVDQHVMEYRREMAAAYASSDRAPATALLNAMLKAAKHAADSNTEFASWVRHNIGPLLEQSQLALESWAFRVRKEADSQISDFVEALDRFDFLGLLDREASDEEFACLLILKGIQLPKRPTKLHPVSVEEVITTVAKAVHKSRLKRGRPHLIRKMRRERQDLVDPLHWLDEQRRFIEDPSGLRWLGAKDPKTKREKV